MTTDEEIRKKWAELQSQKKPYLYDDDCALELGRWVAKEAEQRGFEKGQADEHMKCVKEGLLQAAKEQLTTSVASRMRKEIADAREEGRAEGIDIPKVIELMHNAAVGMYDTKEEMEKAIAAAREKR